MAVRSKRANRIRLLHELKNVVTVALTTAELSHSQNAGDLPVTEWLFDPTDIERERVGLRGILAAVTELERSSSTPAPETARQPGHLWTEAFTAWAMRER